MQLTDVRRIFRVAGVVNVQAGTGSVELQRYPASHPFAQLQGSDNIIAFTTARYRCRQLVILDHVSDHAPRRLHSGLLYGTCRWQLTCRLLLRLLRLMTGVVFGGTHTRMSGAKFRLQGYKRLSGCWQSAVAQLTGALLLGDLASVQACS